MTSSSGTKRWLPSGTNRLKIGGTLTRAKCSLSVFGLRTSDGEVERQPGDVGERVGRVDRERREHREDPLLEQLLAVFCSSRSRSSHRTSSMPSSASAGMTSSRKQRACRAVRSPVSRQICSSTSRGISPDAARTATPAAMRRLRPATRTMKNSSRLLAKIARNRARSSSGRLSSSASSSTRWLKRSQESSRSRKRSSNSPGANSTSSGAYGGSTSKMSAGTTRRLGSSGPSSVSDPTADWKLSVDMVEV